LSYKKLLNAWKKERESSEVQDIPEGFILEMRKYISVLNQTPTDPDTLMGNIVQKERKYAAQMLSELVNNRIEKIILSELNGLPLDAKSLTPEEQKLYSNIRQLIAGYKEGVELPDVEKFTPTPESPSVDVAPSSEVIKQSPGKEVEMLVVRFLQQVPAIMGIDMKAYGPFSKEDVASIPRQNALNLIRRGIAKPVDIEP
jgi:DNA replication initiation complex subunit (GINS family)